MTLCPSRCHGDSYHHCQSHRQDQSDSEAPSRRRVAVRPGLVAWHGSGLAGQRKVPLPRAPCRLAAISRLTEREQGAGGACFSDPGPAGHFPSPSKSVEAVREQTEGSWPHSFPCRVAGHRARNGALDERTASEAPRQLSRIGPVMQARARWARLRWWRPAGVWAEEYCGPGVLWCALERVGPKSLSSISVENSPVFSAEAALSANQIA